MRNGLRRGGPRRTMPGFAKVAIASAAIGLGAFTASAAPAIASTATTTTVVKVANRPPFGNILTNTKGFALYIHPVGLCTGACLASWPPLLMPKGTATPGGAKCLTTVKFGSTGRQVEYMGQRLYTFTSDTATSVFGNGLAGFKVAKVSKTCP